MEVLPKQHYCMHSLMLSLVICVCGYSTYFVLCNRPFGDCQHKALAPLILGRQVAQAWCLGLQVYKVFAQLCPALGLRLGLASGKVPLAVEAEVLIDQSAEEPCCAVDALVATPGRLMSHLQGTPGMHLDCLKMLVSPRGTSIQCWSVCVSCDIIICAKPCHQAGQAFGSI